MIKIKFSEEDIKFLKYERYHNENSKAQEKMEVLYLKSKGLTHNEICKICDISRPTLVKYLKAYVAKGLDGLKETKYKGQPSELSKHIIEIKEYFKNNPPSSTAEAQAKIHEITGIKRSPTQIRLFLNKLGMSCRKLGVVPGKGITPEKIQEQEIFKDIDLMPRLEEAKEGKREFFF
jgi:transposase